MSRRIRRALRIAKAVRRAAEEISASRRRKGQHFPHDLSGACGDVSAVLAGLLGAPDGMTVELMAGFYVQYKCHHAHCWVTINGTVWDLTATQFRRDRAGVYRCRGRGYQPACKGDEAMLDIESWGDEGFRSEVLSLARFYLR